MTIVTANGLATHCQLLDAAPEKAVGETVVFIHGLGTDSLASFHLTLAAPLAAAGIDVVSYDLRGHGRTQRPRSGYTIDRFVEDLYDLLDQLGVPGRVHLVGNSFGGTVAFSFASAHPARVASIVSIEAEPATDVWADKMTDILSRTVEFLADEANFAWIETQFSAHHRRLARMAAERILSTSMAQEIPLGPLLGAADLAELRSPVLSLLGSDGYQSGDLHALTSILPSAELVVFPGQGHSVLVERHREVRAHVLEWVGRHRSGLSWLAS